MDHFQFHGDRAGDPARQAFAITPSDSQPLPIIPKALLIGTAGNLTLRAMDSGDDVTISVAQGQIVPIRVSHIRSAGTTAGQIIGLA